MNTSQAIEQIRTEAEAAAKTEWQGKEFAPVFYRAMAEWHAGGEVGLHPQKLWENSTIGSARPCWRLSGAEPFFDNSVLYRWKPTPKRTVTINGKVLVAPETVAPPMGAIYYLFSVSDFVEQDWENIDCELGWLVEGRVFLTQEDAQAMSDWLTKCRLGQTITAKGKCNVGD